MARYFIDTEFRECPHTIDLISIGIKAEDGRELYEISKDFNIKKAWNAYDIKEVYPTLEGIRTGETEKEYWLRENVLRPIFNELYMQDADWEMTSEAKESNLKNNFTRREFKRLIKKYGKSNEQIAKQIIKFCRPKSEKAKGFGVDAVIEPVDFPEFYGYFSSYDWVVFCWLFGRMEDLPKGFPMYCHDLKQMLDDKGLDGEWVKKNCFTVRLEHNALSDAKWNFMLYEKINKI